MATLSAVSFPLLLSIFIVVTIKSTVLGDCSFPSAYTNKFWFRMYSDITQQKYIYRIFTSNVDDMQNDNATLFKNHYPCSSIVTDTTDPNTVYYLYDNYGIQTCAKSVITSDSSSILLQEVAVNSTVTDASQCISFIIPNGSLWMSVVTSLSQPPPFASSSLCPFPGFFQMTASLSSSPSTIECSGDVQSTAIFYGSNAQLNLCGQGTLRNTTFKSKTILAQDPLTCMASVDGRALNANETGSTIVLLRDSNAIYCARYRNVSVGLELSINVRNDANYAGCFFTATSTNPVLQLILIPVTSTPGLSTTTTPLSTVSLSAPTTTSTAVSPASSITSSTTSTSSTVTGSSTTGSTGTGTGSTPTSSTATGSTTTSSTTSITSPASVPTSSTSLPTSSTSLPTTPYTTTSTTTSTTPATTQSTTTTTTVTATSLVTPGPTSSTSPGASTTTRGTSKGPPVDIAWPSDNCPATPCGAPATCNEATHNCSCMTVFYTYSSNSSRCIQDDRSIDDTFLKIVVPVIATAIIGTLIAALALCFATSSSLDATALDGAALAAASADAGVAPTAAPAVQPPQTLPQENPVFVSYGSNDTYANLDTIDRSLVTYGDQPTVAPPLPPSNYVLVGSSIPAKM